VPNTTAYPFNPNPDAYKPTNVTGAPASTYELALTDPISSSPSNGARISPLTSGSPLTLPARQSSSTAARSMAPRTSMQTSQPRMVPFPVRITDHDGSSLPVRRSMPSPGSIRTCRTRLFWETKTAATITASRCRLSANSPGVLRKVGIQLRGREKHRRSGFDCIRFVEWQPGAGQRQQCAGGLLAYLPRE